MASKTAVLPDLTEIPEGVCLMGAPNREHERVDLAYAVWTGAADIIEEHRVVGGPRLKAARRLALERAAKEAVDEAERAWLRVYRSGETLDEAALIDAAMARQDAVRRHSAMSFRPRGMLPSHAVPAGLTARWSLCSNWALAMLDGGLVPESLTEDFERVAHPARNSRQQALGAREALEQADANGLSTQQIRAARKVLAAADAAKAAALATINSRRL